MYILFGERGTGASCVEAALALAGAPYELREVILEKNEQLAPEFRALNPSGKVPALQLPEGGIVTETSALMIVIAERHPEAELLPALGTPERAQALRWLAFMAAEVYPHVEIADFPERFIADHKGAAVLKLASKRRIRERMEAVEQAFAGPWFLGGALSAVDIYASMFSRWRECRAESWRDEHIPKICTVSAALFEHPVVGPVWKAHFPNG